MPSCFQNFFFFFYSWTLDIVALLTTNSVGEQNPEFLIAGSREKTIAVCFSASKQSYNYLILKFPAIKRLVQCISESSNSEAYLRHAKEFDYYDCSMCLIESYANRKLTMLRSVSLCKLLVYCLSFLLLHLPNFIYIKRETCVVPEGFESEFFPLRYQYPKFK